MVALRNSAVVSITRTNYAIFAKSVSDLVSAVFVYTSSLNMLSLEFFIDIKSFRSHYGPGVDSASNRNEYQGHFLEVKSGRCVRLTTLPPFWAFVTYSENLNFLEPSGHLGSVMGLLYLYL